MTRNRRRRNRRRAIIIVTRYVAAQLLRINWTRRVRNCSQIKITRWKIIYEAYITYLRFIYASDLIIIYVMQIAGGVILAKSHIKNIWKRERRFKSPPNYNRQILALHRNVIDRSQIDSLSAECTLQRLKIAVNHIDQQRVNLFLWSARSVWRISSGKSDVIRKWRWRMRTRNRARYPRRRGKFNILKLHPFDRALYREP